MPTWDLPRRAIAALVLGRIVGLPAHYFEQITNFRPMRWINFREARYRYGLRCNR